MGRMAELAYEREQIEQEVAIARMEAEHELMPKTYAESLEINRALREQLGALAKSYELNNSTSARNQERAIGFALGIGASLVAALIWWLAATQWSALKG